MGDGHGCSFYSITQGMFCKSACVCIKLKGTIDDASTEAWIEEVEDRPFHDMRYPLDHSKMVALGWKPRVSWEDGLQQTSKSHQYCIHER